MKRKTEKLGFHGLGVILILLAGLFVCATFGASATFAQTAPSTITIDAPGAGTSNGQGTWATAINAAGVISGYFVDSHACHGFVRNSDGTYVTFDTPVSPLGATTCPQPASINAAGVITGVDGDPSLGCKAWSPSDRAPIDCGGNHGFIRRADGTIIVFDGPVDPSFSNPMTIPMSINAAGAAVGQYNTCDQSVCSTSFLRSQDGTFGTFDPPGVNPYAGPRAVGINASGTIAGVFGGDDYIQHGYLRGRNGTFAIVDAPGATGGTWIRGINSSGEVAGDFADANSVGHGYVRAPNGTITVFDAPGSVSTGTESINDEGTIVGSYAAPTPSGPYNWHIFLRAADGTFTTFDAPNRSFVVGSGISSTNAVVGYYQDANYVTHGFLRLAH